MCRCMTSVDFHFHIHSNDFFFTLSDYSEIHWCLHNTDRTSDLHAVKQGHNVMKWTEYRVSLETGFVLSEEHNVMVNSDELMSTAEYMAV